MSGAEYPEIKRKRGTIMSSRGAYCSKLAEVLGVNPHKPFNCAAHNRTAKLYGTQGEIRGLEVI